MATGRTVGKYVKIQIESSTGGMCDIPCNSFGSVGLTFAEQDVSALQEAITSVLNGQGSFSTTISGPFDNSAQTAASASTEAPKLSGSHTILNDINGGNTALSFGIYIGVQGYWTDGDPVFGAIDSVLISQYTVDPAAGTYSAKIATAGNRLHDPAWGTAVIAAST